MNSAHQKLFDEVRPKCTHPSWLTIWPIGMATCHADDRQVLATALDDAGYLWVDEVSPVDGSINFAW